MGGPFDAGLRACIQGAMFAGMMPGSVNMVERLTMDLVCDGAKCVRYLFMLVVVIVGWGQASIAHAMELALNTWSCDIDGLYEFRKSDYISLRLTVSADVSYPMASRGSWMVNFVLTASTSRSKTIRPASIRTSTTPV